MWHIHLARDVKIKKQTPQICVGISVPLCPIRNANILGCCTEHNRSPVAVIFRPKGDKLRKENYNLTHGIYKPPGYKLDRIR